MHGGLAGRVGAADDVYGFALAGNGFRSAAAIVDARALEFIDTWDVERAPLNTHGEQQNVRGDFGTVGEFQIAIRAIDSNAGCFLRRKNFDPKSFGLRDGAAGKITTS